MKYITILLFSILTATTLLITILLTAPAGMGEEPFWSPQANEFTGEIQCKNKKCISILESSLLIRKNGFPSRAALEDVFQARQRILSRMGSLLPRLQFYLGLHTLPNAALDSFSNLFGFLVPSNWFNWQEGRLLYMAQKNLYFDLVKTQIIDTQILYYNLHRMARDIRIYQFYSENLSLLINQIQSNIQKNKNKVAQTDLLLLQNFQAELLSDNILLKSLLNNWFIYDLAVAVGYPHQLEIGIRPIPLPTLGTQHRRVFQESELQLMLESSNVLQGYHYLIRATHYSALSRLFSFLSANNTGTTASAGISLGLANFAEFRIEKSQRRRLQVKRKEVRAQLESYMRKIIDNSNDAVDLYLKLESAKSLNRELLSTVLTKFQQSGELETYNLISGIHWALKFEINRNFALHSYLIYMAQLRRLQSQGEEYSNITLK